jgi:hypothetical protein
VLYEVGLDVEVSKKYIDVIIYGQEMRGNASLPVMKSIVINPMVINSTEVNDPTRVLGVYLLRNKLFLVHRLGVKQTEILEVLGGFFAWVLHKVGLDVEESKKKIDMIISGQEMGGNASLPTVINPTVINPIVINPTVINPTVINPTVINSTEVSGPTRVSWVYLLRNKLFLVHRLGIK